MFVAHAPKIEHAGDAGDFEAEQKAKGGCRLIETLLAWFRRTVRNPGISPSSANNETAWKKKNWKRGILLSQQATHKKDKTEEKRKEAGTQDKINFSDKTYV